MIRVNAPCAYPFLSRVYPLWLLSLSLAPHLLLLLLLLLLATTAGPPGAAAAGAGAGSGCLPPAR